jgi:hypothetical protein
MKLLPCKGCGGEPYSEATGCGWGYHVVGCMKCKVEVRASAVGKDWHEKQARKAEEKWNKLMGPNTKE